MINKFKLKSEFSRNVLTLMTGSTIAQAIPIAISPILTRIYTPEDYGMMALFMSVASIVTIASTGRYELAIMLPKKDSDAVNIVVVSIIISLFISLISFLIVFIFNDEITKLLGSTSISNWLYLIPISVLLTGVYQSVNYWNNRKKDYKRLAVNKIILSGTGATLNLGFGFSGFGGGGLIAAGILSHGLATLVLAIKSWIDDHKLLSHVNKLKMISLMKKYKKLPFFNLPNSLVDIFKMSGINILIVKLFDTTVLGQYSLAWRMVLTPASLLGRSLSQVFFQKLATTKRYELNTLVKKFLIKASLFAAPPYLLVFFFSPDIFGFVFGEQWEVAGQLASALTPWLFLNFITSPLSTIYIVLNRQEIMLVFSIFYMFIPLSILIMYQELEFVTLIGYMALGMSSVLILFIILILYLTSRYRLTSTSGE